MSKNGKWINITESQLAKISKSTQRLVVSKEENE